LESLYQITYPNSEVIVVDNGSEDGSIVKIKEYAEGKIKAESKFFEYSSENKPIKIVEHTREEAEAGGEKEKEIDDLASNKKLIIVKNEKNYGFAEGNNIGMRYALNALNPYYVLLLNNDTVVGKEFLGELVNLAESDLEIGIVGPKTYYYSQPNRIQLTWNKIDFYRGTVFLAGAGDIDRGQHNKIRDTDYVPGSCLLIKQKTIKRIGLLDASYYSYWEETDYCMRAKRAVFRLVYCPNAKIWHKISQSASKVAGFSTYYMTRNRFQFMKKYATRRQYLLFLLYFFGFEFWFTSGIYIVYHKDISAFISFFRGVMDGLKTIHK
jgi:GT2 family glycosyltransferase